MDLLVAGSTSIAYIYSLILSGFLMVGKPIHKSFFETSTPLMMLIMVGCLMLVFTRHCTTSALNTDDTLQVQMVNLVENNHIQSIPTKLFHIRDILQVVIRHYFCLYFSSIFNPTSLHIPYPISLPYVHPCYVFLLMFSHSQTDNKNTF